MLRYNRGTEKGKTNEEMWTTTEKRSVMKHNTIGHFKAKKTTLKKVVKCTGVYNSRTTLYLI